MLVTIGAHGIERDGTMILVRSVITRVAVCARTILGAVSVKRGRKVLRVTDRAIQRSMPPDQFRVIMCRISGRSPTGRLMTSIALKCDPGVVCRLSCCDLAVMTIGALTGGTGIVNIARGGPCRRLMTGVALRRGRDVVLRFARRLLAVVAG